MHLDLSSFGETLSYVGKKEKILDREGFHFLPVHPYTQKRMSWGLLRATQRFTEPIATHTHTLAGPGLKSKPLEISVPPYSFSEHFSTIRVISIVRLSMSKTFDQNMRNSKSMCSKLEACVHIRRPKRVGAQKTQSVDSNPERVCLIPSQVAN